MNPDELHLHVHLPGQAELTEKLDQILGLLRASARREIAMIVEVDQMIAQAKLNRDAEAAAVQAFQQWAARLDAAVAKALADNPSVTPEQLAAITSETALMKTSADALGAAVVADTPQA